MKLVTALRPAKAAQNKDTGHTLGNDRCDCNPGNIQMESNHQDQV